MSKQFPDISIEKFAAYLDDNLPYEEMAQIDHLVDSDENLQSLLSMNDVIDNYSMDNGFELPEEIQSDVPLAPDTEAGITEAMALALESFSDFFQEDDENAVQNMFYGETSIYQQQYSDTCAIKAQQIILNDFNIPCTEDQLVQYSMEHGWYDGHGTNMSDVGKLLEEGGVPCSQRQNANVYDLVDELSQGHKIIVGVDADELWHDDTIKGKFWNWYNDFFHGDTPNHAIIVAGIDTSDPNNIQVLITDPGTGDYHKAYPLDQFMDAWSDSSCFMVSTDVSVPQTSPQMAHFDYSAGHVDSVGGVDFSEFQIFNDFSHGIPCEYMIVDGEMCNPMNSFVDAYFDYAHNDDMMFSDIFNHDQYLFNDFLDQDVVTPLLQDSFNFGMEQIGFGYENDWNHYAALHNIPMMTNQDYANFLDQSILDFQMAGDLNSVSYCEQQYMMLDYCDEFGLDFSDTFFDLQ